MTDTSRAAGIYIHVPFCRRKCPYCDFYSLPFGEDLADAYTDALLRAMAHQPFRFPKADTLYLGGGTPSLLGAERLTRLLEGAAALFGLDGDSEITLEANPDTVSLELLKALRESGFNRISFGVQSGVDAELQALGRPHTATAAREAILAAHDAGFGNVSADLMLAIPGQTPVSLSRSIAWLSGLPLGHISAYLLKTEPGTPFYERKDTLALPDEDQAAALYLQCVEELAAAGFGQYEISNFARGDKASRHNLIYWRCGEYLGLGPAAHSFLHCDSHPAPAAQASPATGTRYAFGRDLDAFLGAENPFQLLEQTGEGGDPEERLMLALRLTEGFDAHSLPEGLRGKLLQKAAALAVHGLCRIEQGVISLTPQGFLLSNTVTVALLEALEESPQDKNRTEEPPCFHK